MFLVIITLAIQNVFRQIRSGQNTLFFGLQIVCLIRGSFLVCKKKNQVDFAAGLLCLSPERWEAEEHFDELLLVFQENDFFLEQWHTLLGHLHPRIYTEWLFSIMEPYFWWSHITISLDILKLWSLIDILLQFCWQKFVSVCKYVWISRRSTLLLKL